MRIFVFHEQKFPLIECVGADQPHVIIFVCSKKFKEESIRSTIEISFVVEEEEYCVLYANTMSWAELC